MARKLMVAVLLVVGCGIGAIAEAAESEDLGSGPPASHQSSHALLSSLDEAQRANAVIEFELFGESDLAARLQAEQVASLWNEGRKAEALNALDRLESTGATLVVGIAWQVPVPASAPEYYADVPIGDGRTGYGDSALGSSGASGGNIFVLVQWDSGWSMNISTNRGVSFSETYFWGTFAPADMDVVGDHAWVGYAFSGEARMRRFHVADGSEDTGYGFATITSVAPNTISEVAVSGDAPDHNSRIYMTYIVPETGVIDYWWDDLAGASFSMIATGITDAVNGLDMTWNPYSKLGIGYLWIMYLSSSQVHIYMRSGSGWVREASQDFTGLQRHTGISAYGDNVYGVYQKSTPTGELAVVYMTTPDAGGGWLVDDAYWPDPGGRSAHGPNISVRSGMGRAVVFTSDESTNDIAWHAQRRGWSPGLWEAPFSFSNQDAGWGARTEIEWIQSLCVGSYGLVYRNDDFVPYFDLITPRCFFSDGFETGNTSVWDVTTP